MRFHNLVFFHLFHNVSFCPANETSKHFKIFCNILIEYSHEKRIRHILLTFNKKTDTRTGQKIVFHEKQNSSKFLLE